MYCSPTWCILLVCAHVALAREWAWPDAQESVRIDTKVRFLDDGASDKTKRGSVQSDEAPFRQPETTDGFYNRPPGEGRFPMRVVNDQNEAYRVNSARVFRVQSNKNDGTVDSVNFCKCVSEPECNPRSDSAEICGAGKYLCCFKRPNRAEPTNSEFFNEIEDERPMLFPGKERLNGPFAPPPNTAQSLTPTHNSEYFDFGPVNVHQHNKHVLVGPGGPTGNIGPPQPQVLVGPGGSTGVIGPANTNQNMDATAGNRGVLVGPKGPSGIIGPTHTNQNFGANGDDIGVFVGQSEPSGVLGPASPNQNLVASAAAQRGVLVGPGGPTGIIGPYGQQPVLTGPRGPRGNIGPNRNRGVLVGPGGPTGIIGPGYGRQSGPGLLVGPGGPTGTIRPGRQLLVGPGGPTGRIGPQRYYGNY